MAYSEKLIREVKRCYPGNNEIINYAISGNYSLGDKLEEMSIPLSHSDVITATDLNKLKIDAKLRVDRHTLYEMWVDEALQ